MLRRLSGAALLLLLATGLRAQQRPAAAPVGRWRLDSPDTAAVVNVRIWEPAPGIYLFAIEAAADSSRGGFRGALHAPLGCNQGYTNIDPVKQCQVHFCLVRPDLLQLRQSDGTCGLPGGLSVSGRYRRPGADSLRRALPPLLRFEVLPSAAVLARFKALVGPDYAAFERAFERVFVEDAYDKGISRVSSGFVRGQERRRAAIVAYGPGGQLWAAVVDARNPQLLRYYTTVPAAARRLPASLEQWTKDVPGRRVQYLSKPARQAP
ncbi:hypothetical protein EJV47_14980 [Hymenobacter gummosus]|uniref:DUF4369 domain-containing protein n=1 Tax=Hymenobacter gummosus TaxID=1776032 RepID=A0A431U1E8_9BACT|nr:hypothetical protein [Hymenobacter gummosus]RTQ48897.1 hypothetical protein EJV47_14980 [Hymenobacter gummosus]